MLGFFSETSDGYFDAFDEVAVLCDCIGTFLTEHLFFHIEERFVLADGASGLSQHELNLVVGRKVCFRFLGLQWKTECEKK